MSATKVLPVQHEYFHNVSSSCLTSSCIHWYNMVMKREELLNWRTEHKLRQEDLAQLLGITRVAVTRWENGTRKIPQFLHWALDSISIHLKTKGGENKYAMRKKKTRKVDN